MDRTRLLADQLEWHWENQLRARLDGLTDDEYLWEPVDGCWSLRPREEAVTDLAAGAGDVVADFAHPPPSPPPVTTIAWRMAHISVGVFGARAAAHFDAEPMSYQTTDWPLSAAGGLDLLDRTYRSWIDGVCSLGADDLDRPCGPAEGPFAEEPVAALVLHINREAIHHGAEISLLRDLYLRAGRVDTSPRQPA